MSRYESYLSWEFFAKHCCKIRQGCVEVWRKLQTDCFPSNCGATGRNKRKNWEEIKTTLSQKSQHGDPDATWGTKCPRDRHHKIPSLDNGWFFRRFYWLGTIDGNPDQGTLQRGPYLDVSRCSAANAWCWQTCSHALRGVICLCILCIFCICLLCLWRTDISSTMQFMALPKAKIYV